MADKKKYKLKNIANGPVHIKELRKAIAAGKEIVWVGVLTDGTKRLEEKKFLSIEDLGIATPEDMPKRREWESPLERKEAQEEKERELTKKVRENLAKTKKAEEEPKAKVEQVSASEMGVDTPPAPPPIPEPVEEEPKKNGLDTLVKKGKKKSKK